VKLKSAKDFMIGDEKGKLGNDVNHICTVSIAVEGRFGVEYPSTLTNSCDTLEVHTIFQNVTIKSDFDLDFGYN